MSGWEKTKRKVDALREWLSDLNDAKETAEAAGGTAEAGIEALHRANNGPLVLTPEQALKAMKMRYGESYPRKTAREMTPEEIKLVEWELVESWKAFRRLSLITNAVQWAISKMITGKPPVPAPTDVLNALTALFNATGDNPTRAEVMEFWQKYSSDQLDMAAGVARGLTETGKKYMGGSQANPSRRKMLEDAMREP